MRNWKNAADYDFPDKASRRRWAWEFLRRNPDYIADYASVPSKTEAQLQDFKNRNPDLISVIRPRFAFAPATWLGHKWHLWGGIQDPAVDTIPNFVISLPDRPLLNSLGKYFEEPDEIGQAEPRGKFAVLVFKLSEDLESQLFAAYVDLYQLQNERGLQPRHKNLLLDKFPTYLRILDAKGAGASNSDIVKYISALEYLADDMDEAHKRINRAAKKGRKLTREPWTII